MNNFYTYIYLDPRKSGKFVYGKYKFNFEPFYIGKGKNIRIYDHLFPSRLKISSTYKSNKIKTLLNLGYDLKKYIFKIHSEISELQAKKLEIELIKKIGRLDLKTGPLTNTTDGGDGTSGFKNLNPQPQSLKTRKKRSISMLGNQNGKGLRGHKQTLEHKKRNAKSRRQITYIQAQEIRSKYKPRIYTCMTLAKEYGISRRAIRQILEFKSYKYPI